MSFSRRAYRARVDSGTLFLMSEVPLYRLFPPQGSAFVADSAIFKEADGREMEGFWQVLCSRQQTTI